MQASKRVGAQPCPGEDVCQIIGPLASYPDQPVEAVCNGCSKRDTKPGMQPRGLADFIAETIQLDELHAIGATFSYPDGLRPFQWVCLRSLERARQRERERTQAAQAQKSDVGALQARLKRG